MPKNQIPYFLKDDVYTRTQFLNADTTSIKDICTAGENGSYVYMINITSTDSVARTTTLFLNDGTNDIPIKFGVSIGIQQGNIANLPDPVRLVQSNSGFILGRILDRDQNFYIPLPAGWKLRARMDSSVTNGTAITFIVHRKDF